jgi:integrase
MKYTRETKGKDGKKRWVFLPPEEALKAGVVKRQTFTDGRTARFEIPKLIEKVEKFRRGEIFAGSVTRSSRLSQLASAYLNSDHFLSLQPSSQKSAEREIRRLLSLEFGAKRIGDIKLKDIDTKLCQKLYHRIESHSSLCNSLQTVLKHGEAIGVLARNPFVFVEKKEKPKPKKVRWTEEQVQEFLDAAYSRFEGRNIGLLAHMVYEWSQRPVDIRNLTWDNFDFIEQKVTIPRDNPVALDLEEPLLSLLAEQKQDWDFQDYVVPHHKPNGVVYKKIHHTSMFQTVKKTTSLPKELNLTNLYTTSVEQLANSGADFLTVMRITGFKSLHTLSRYVDLEGEGEKR